MPNVSQSKYRWGILGTGYAASQFVTGLKTLANADVVSVASRSQPRAESFAKMHQIERCFSSYDDLIDDPEVDVIYIGTTLPSHHELCLRSIERGKAVLCEKPFAFSVQQATEIRDAAQSNHVFCMEAMWSRFIPLMRRVRQLVLDGAIGELQVLSADFGLRQTPQSQPRLFDPVEGGALRDLGVYPISLAVQYLGMPKQVDVTQVFESGGADFRAAGTLHYESGAVASVAADIRCQLPTRATLIGTEGYIEIESPMYRPTVANLVRSARPLASEPMVPRGAFEMKLRRVASVIRSKLQRNRERIRMGYAANGYQYQAAEVMDCLDSGVIESKVMPLQETIDVMKVIERVIQPAAKHGACELDQESDSTTCSAGS